jgi:hypothetical protein
VLVAAYVVKSLPLVTLRWVVVFNVLYAALPLLRSTLKSPGGREQSGRRNAAARPTFEWPCPARLRRDNDRQETVNFR